jgi:hypothetical protein
VRSCAAWTARSRRAFDVAKSLKRKIKRGAAHADGRERRDDLVGLLAGIAGNGTERAGSQFNRDIAGAGFPGKYRAVQLQGRSGTKRKIGVIAKHEFCVAVGGGADGFVAKDFIAGADLDDAGRDLRNIVEDTVTANH